MNRREQAQWMVSGSVAAPVERVWRTLIESNPDLSPEDKAASSTASGPDPFTRTIAQPGGGALHLEISARRHRLAMQGEWWYRGEYSIEPDGRGSRLVYRVYNIAPGAGWWAAQLVQGPQHARAMRAHVQELLRTIGERLGCAFHMDAA